MVPNNFLTFFEKKMTERHAKSFVVQRLRAMLHSGGKLKMCETDNDKRAYACALKSSKRITKLVEAFKSFAAAPRSASRKIDGANDESIRDLKQSGSSFSL
jgi:hypothetical protein